MYDVVELISVVGVFVKTHVPSYGIFNRLLRASLRFGICHKVECEKKSTAAFSFKMSKDVV